MVHGSRRWLCVWIDKESKISNSISKLKNFRSGRPRRFATPNRPTVYEVGDEEEEAKNGRFMSKRSEEFHCFAESFGSYIT